MKGKTHTSTGKEHEAFQPVSTGITAGKSTFGQTDQKPGLADSVDPIFRDRHFKSEAQGTSGQDVQKSASADARKDMCQNGIPKLEYGKLLVRMSRSLERQPEKINICGTSILRLGCPRVLARTSKGRGKLQM